MGIDFLKRTAPSYQRALDRRAIELREPQVLASNLPPSARTATAELREGAALVLGERILLRWLGDQLVVQRETRVAATFGNPPAELLARVAQSGGVEIGVVQAVRPISGEVEISLCD